MDGAKVAGYSVIKTIDVVTIFIISGLTLQNKDVQSAVRAWRSLLWGLLAILVVTPLLGFVAVNIPFNPSEFRYGLALFCSVPAHALTRSI